MKCFEQIDNTLNIKKQLDEIYLLSMKSQFTEASKKAKSLESWLKILAEDEEDLYEDFAQ